MLSNDARETFATLYGDLEGEVAGHVHRLMRGRTLDALSAEDVVQTVWTKVWAHLPTVELRPGHGRHDGLRSWVHTIARNTVLDATNRARYRRQVSLAPDGCVDHGTLNESGDPIRSDPGFEASPATDPHGCAVRNEVAGVLREALGVMTAHQRRCMLGMLAGHDSVRLGDRLTRSDRGVRHAILRGRRTFEAVAAQRGVELCR